MVKLIFATLALVALAASAPKDRKEGPPCGLPPYVDEMPEAAKEKVLEIWKDYKEGDKCYNEQGLTREVMDTLTKEERRAVFKGAFMPAFLKKAPKDIQDQFKTILKDKTVPFEQKGEKFKELADKILTGDLLVEFNKFYEKLEKHRAAFQDKVAKLSAGAKEAYEKLEKLETEKRDIYHSVTDEVRDELYDVYKERLHMVGGLGFRGRHGHH